MKKICFSNSLTILFRSYPLEEMYWDDCLSDQEEDTNGNDCLFDQEDDTISHHISIGVIKEIYFSNNGTKNVVLKVNEPFRSEYLLFICPNMKTMLDVEEFSVEDEVLIRWVTNQYDFQQKLIYKIEEMPLEKCPEGRCHVYLEAQNAQRMECPYCTDSCDNPFREWKEMTFVKSFFSPHKHMLVFKDDKDKEWFSKTIYPENPIFKMVTTLEKQKVYTVLAWYPADDLDFKFDIVAIFESGSDSCHPLI